MSKNLKYFIRPKLVIISTRIRDVPHATDLEDIEGNHFSNVEIDTPEPSMVKLREEGIVRPEHLVDMTM